jgi:20S proteasome subunit beta 7
MLAGDTLGSYGSLARFGTFERIVKVSDDVAMAAGGDLSDFQYIQKMVKKVTLADFCRNDGQRRSAKELWNYMTRVMYERRSKGDPLWNQLVLAGYRDGDAFMGLVDLRGTAYEEKYIATGYGQHIALPLLRHGWRDDLTETEAVDLLRKAMRVLMYRECRTLNRVQFAKIDADGVHIAKPAPLDLDWSIAHNVSH